MSGSTSVTVTTIDGIPAIRPTDDAGRIIADVLTANGQGLQDGDIVCVASKIISSAEGRTVLLDDIEPAEPARQLHSRVPRKDVRVLQMIIDQTGDPTGDRIVTADNYVGGWLPNGLMLTSAGVDKAGSDAVVLLPEDPDASAARIAAILRTTFGHQVGVIITDSDGRPDKRGATQIAIGVHGVPPLRTDHGEETLCDMLAAAAAIVMGQRGTGRPVAVIRGVDYTYDPDAHISQSLHAGNALDSA